MKTRFNRPMISILALALLIGGTVACTQKADPAGDDKLDVMVSIVPQHYFVERIGGDRVRVHVMVDANADPHTYEPKPDQMRALSRSVAYLSIGVEFEAAWLDKFTAANPDLQVVDTIATIERMPMVAPHDQDKEGEDQEHAKGAPDPHVWLSPELVKVQGQAIYEGLAQLDPAHKDSYKDNLDAFIADIDALELEIKTTLSGMKSNKFMVFHPAWGYFARDFNLEQTPVEVGGQEPSARELAHLIEKAQEEGIQIVFAQPEFSTKAAETIAQEIGGEVLLISPLAPDWLENMRKVAQTFADVLNR